MLANGIVQTRISPPRSVLSILSSSFEVQTELKKKEDEATLIAPYSKSFSRTMIKSILESESGGLSLVDKTIRVGGWVKTGRVAGAGAFAFLELNDGSCFSNLQIMVEKEVGDEMGGLKEMVATATCVLVEGKLAETPEGTKQKVRIRLLKCFIKTVNMHYCCCWFLNWELSRSESGAHSANVMHQILMPDVAH